jgi:hypothetical protein
MSNLPGTNIIAAIVPFTELDQYATHDAKYGKGGYRSVTNVTARNNIPPDRRSIGMTVRTTDDNIVWILTSDDGTLNCVNCVWVKEVDTLSMDGGEF